MKLKELINKSGYFYLENNKRVKYPGVLKKKDTNYYLELSFKPKTQLIADEVECAIWGSVCGCDITLRNPFVIRRKCMMNNITITISFSELILGGLYNNSFSVKMIRAYVPELSYFLHEQTMVVDESNFDELTNFRFPKENEIIIKDSQGEVIIGQHYKCVVDKNYKGIKKKPYIEYSFNEETNLEQAMKCLCSVRNLLAFFADYYIGYKKIEIEDNHGHHCKIIYNYSPVVNNEKRLFLINQWNIPRDCQGIWTAWKLFKEDNAPIIDLFYEIICDRSEGINRLLNMTQALEIYSDRKRDKYAKKIRQMFKEKHSYNAHQTQLVHRIFDLLEYTTILDVEKEEDNIYISRSIADVRNFYTHYNKTVMNEPDYEIISLFTNLSRAMLLCIIYSELGIEKSDVLQYVRRNYAYYIQKLKHRIEAEDLYIMVKNNDDRNE